MALLEHYLLLDLDSLGPKDYSLSVTCVKLGIFLLPIAYMQTLVLVLISIYTIEWFSEM